MVAKEMLILKRGYDFSKWLLRHTGKFPKSYRFSIAAKLENGILTFIELTAVANMRREKLPLLTRADETLARLRLLFRLSFEMRFIDITSYEFGSRQIDEPHGLSHISDGAGGPVFRAIGVLHPSAPGVG